MTPKRDSPNHFLASEANKTFRIKHEYRSEEATTFVKPETIVKAQYTHPNCLSCKAKLPREIKTTSAHHESCPWNYYIECENCGYQNNLSKLLGFWHGCSTKCKQQTFNTERTPPP